MRITALLLPAVFTATAVHAQTDSTDMSVKLKGVVVNATHGTRMDRLATNTELIGSGQLLRAACCNLGESFTASPSVDVNYADAATGARQIKLLGLSGTYVQMLTENIPNLRGASLPYSLGYVPGPWMQSIQVSKGASSVKNGYESTTGQINIEFLKPQGTDGVRGNLYFDSQAKLEANADASVHLSDRLSTSVLLHYENRQRDHDGNGDGFMDMPKVRQYNLMHRWAYFAPGFISQLSVRLLRDERNSGTSHHGRAHRDMPRYAVHVGADRYEAQWKNAVLFRDSHNSSLALMLHGSWHDAGYLFGNRRYGVDQKNGYAQLMFETDITDRHSLSVGASLNHDHFDETFSGNLQPILSPSETTAGLYAQYTYKPSDRLTVMPGIRWDRSDLYGSFVTPRLHVKYSPFGPLTLRASAGKGYRTPHALAENVPMLASGRTFYADPHLEQEEAWNCGLSAQLNVPLGEKTLELNAEYYYTHFIRQMVATVDGAMGAHTVVFGNLDGRSYSHTMQVDATCPIVEGLTATAAFRLNDVRTTYDGTLRRQPLTSRYKGLLTLSYKTPMELWHFDVTGHLNGGGELYDRTAYPAYFQLQAQVTRDFRHFSVYAGGENLTGYKMARPIAGADNPWAPAFDATQIWGPTEGAMAYVGIRVKFEKP